MLILWMGLCVMMQAKAGDLEKPGWLTTVTVRTVITKVPIVSVMCHQIIAMLILTMVLVFSPTCLLCATSW